MPQSSTFSRSRSGQTVTRRELIRSLGAGFGGVALAAMLADESRATEPEDPLAPKGPHFPARARSVIMLMMDGAPSHHDLFDYKPLLVRDDGKPFPFELPRVLSNTDRFGTLRQPLRTFRRRGQSGAWVSDFLPHISRVVDDLCFIHSMHCSNSQHGAALLEWHTGSTTFERPSLGSWLLYGLGSESHDLPGYITISQPMQMAGANVYGSSFLPAVCQGTPLGYDRVDSSQATFPFISNPKAIPELQRQELDLIRDMGHSHLARTGANSALEARIKSFELAFRMQTEVPLAQDISGESQATQKLYGLDQKATANFGRQCLLARRFVERGVRFMQCNLGGWDHHDNLSTGMPKQSLAIDKPIAGLITDLRQRGLLDDTLVIWGGEFGRTPMSEGSDGRDHNPYGYTMWMAGGGVKPGITYGSTDDYGFRAVENPVHVHDLHATILHLLGLDHERLTYRYAGRDFRLTDVEGNVVWEVLA